MTKNLGLNRRIGAWAVTSALAVALAMQATNAAAGEPEIRRAVENLYPAAKVSSVTPTAATGIFEVVAGGEILYSDANGSTLFLGQMVDVASRTNMTAQRLEKLSAIKFSELPLELAIKTVKGDGSRMLATFEDPNCGYCKQLHTGLKQLTNYTLYTFLMPILSEDSKVKSRQIWCSPDRSKAFTEWMSMGVAPAEGKCSTPVDKVLELGQRLRINGTPAIFFADGTRSPGYLPADRLEKKLSESTMAVAVVDAATKK